VTAQKSAAHHRILSPRPLDVHSVQRSNTAYTIYMYLCSHRPQNHRPTNHPTTMSPPFPTLKFHRARTRHKATRQRDDSDARTYSSDLTQTPPIAQSSSLARDPSTNNHVQLWIRCDAEEVAAPAWWSVYPRAAAQLS
jgi:hypothetical protein